LSSFDFRNEESFVGLGGSYDLGDGTGECR